MKEIKGALAMIVLFFGFATLLVASESHPVLAKMNEQLNHGLASQIEAPTHKAAPKADMTEAARPLEDFNR